MSTKWIEETPFENVERFCWRQEGGLCSIVVNKSNCVERYKPVSKSWVDLYIDNQQFRSYFFNAMTTRWGEGRSFVLAKSVIKDVLSCFSVREKDAFRTLSRLVNIKASNQVIHSRNIPVQILDNSSELGCLFLMYLDEETSNHSFDTATEVCEAMNSNNQIGRTNPEELIKEIGRMPEDMTKILRLMCNSLGDSELPTVSQIETY